MDRQNTKSGKRHLFFHVQKQGTIRLPAPASLPTRAINAVAVLQLRNYVDDSQHGTFRALGVARMGMETMDGKEEGGRKRSATVSRR